MPELVQDVMTSEPICLDMSATVSEAAQRMRDNNIGDVLVTDQGRLRGVVTDRDVVIRAIANGMQPDLTSLGHILTAEPICANPNDPVSKAVTLMREHALRRLPVCDGDRIVGIVSLGDLARDRDPDSALADISAAPATH
jgi:CBS domain-containing protein